MPLCRVCGSDDLHLFLDLGMQPYCNGFRLVGETAPVERFPLRAFFCNSCTTVQIDHTIPKERMFGHGLYVSGTTRTLKQHFQESVDRLLAFLDSGDLVVDIGSNDGTWLSCYPDEIRKLGIESAGNLVTVAQAHDVPTWNAFFDAGVALDILEECGHARLVTAAGVFFHLEQLHSVTVGVASLIGNDGIFCVQAIYLGGMIESGAFDQIYHEHLTYWSLGSLSALLSLHGLEVFSVRRLAIHGGSMEYMIAATGAREIDGSVRELEEAENRQGLARVETYRKFASRAWSTRANLLHVLDDFPRRQKMVYALGAPAKGTTFLNFCGIGKDRIPAAVERNPLKFGREIPGTGIPIIDESVDLVEMPDAFLVLAWNFLPELMERYSAYIEKGGKFIVPFPEVRVVGRSS